MEFKLQHRVNWGWKYFYWIGSLDLSHPNFGEISQEKKMEQVTAEHTKIWLSIFALNSLTHGHGFKFRLNLSPITWTWVLTSQYTNWIWSHVQTSSTRMTTTTPNQILYNTTWHFSSQSEWLSQCRRTGARTALTVLPDADDTSSRRMVSPSWLGVSFSGPPLSSGVSLMWPPLRWLCSPSMLYSSDGTILS